MWSDENYGFKNFTTLMLWVTYGQQDALGGAGVILQDYFKMRWEQLQPLHQQF